MSNKSKQNLSESSFILIFSTILVKVVSAFFKVPLASDLFLGNLGFGYFSVAHDLFMPFYILAISGLPVAVSHITAEHLTKKHYKVVKDNFYITRRLFLIMGVLVSLLVSLISIPVILSTPTAKDTLYSILAVVPSIFLCFLLSVYRGYFESFCNMFPTAISKLIEALCKLVLGLSFSYIVIKNTNNPAYAAAAAMLGITIGTFFSTLYLHIKLKKVKLLDFNTDENTNEETKNITVKTIFILMVPFVLCSLASSFVSLIDVLTVKLQISNANTEYFNMILSQNPNLFGDTATYLYGIRSKVFTLYYLVPTLTMSLGVGALPILTEIWVKKDEVSLKNNLNLNLKLVSVITFPAGIGMMALSKPIMHLLYSSNDSLSGNLLFIYGLAAIFTGLAIPLTNILQSIDLSVFALKHIIIGIVIKTIANILLLSFSSINIYGVAIGTFLMFLYICLVLFIKMLKTVQGIDLKNSIIKPLLSAVICGITAFVISQISDNKLFYVMAIFLAVLVYFTFILILKTFKKEEVQTFPFGKKLFSIFSSKRNI